MFTENFPIVTEKICFQTFLEFIDFQIALTFLILNIFCNFWSFEKAWNSCFDFWHLERLILIRVRKAQDTVKNPWKSTSSTFGRRALHIVTIATPTALGNL